MPVLYGSGGVNLQVVSAAVFNVLAMWDKLGLICNAGAVAEFEAAFSQCHMRPLACIYSAIRSQWVAPSAHELGSASPNHSFVILPATMRRFWERTWHIYSLDWHIGISQDVRFMLTNLLGLTIEMEEQSFATLCGMRNICVHDPRLIQHSPMYILSSSTLSPCPNAVLWGERFFEAFKNDGQIAQADILLCSVPLAYCEAFLPFNKTILAINSVPVEYGRENEKAFRLWIKHLKLLVSQDFHRLITTSKSDQAHTEYWTGILAPVIESHCYYIAFQVSYAPSQPEFLVGLKSFKVLHEGPDIFQDRILQANEQESSPLPMVRLNDKYPPGTVSFAALAKHPAIIDVPYMKITLTFIEIYMIGVPLLVPSLDLLVAWHIQQHLLTSGVWSNITREVNRTCKSLNVCAPDESTFSQPYPSTSKKDQKALRHWFQFNQPYQMPHVQQFGSIPELIRLLRTLEFHQISMLMRAHASERLLRIKKQWMDMLLHILSHILQEGPRKVPVAGNYEEAMIGVYGKQYVASGVQELSQITHCKRESRMEGMGSAEL